MKLQTHLAVAVFATLASTPMLAQPHVNSSGGSWQSGSTPGIQTNEFWNNGSYDGNNCNIGFFVVGNGFGPCNNQSPGVFMPPLAWVNSAYLAQSTPSIQSGNGFDFSAGSYFVTFFGQIAGANPHREMGIMTSDGSAGLNGVSSIQFGPAISTIQVDATTSWKMYLQSYRPTGTQFYTSMDDEKQFALFANSNGGNGDNSGQWLVGGEDNSCTSVDPNSGCPDLADYDYNDGLVFITAVPEPSSYAMLSVGMLAIGGLVRRRRNARKA